MIHLYWIVLRCSSMPSFRDLVDVKDLISLSWLVYSQPTCMFRRPSYGLQRDRLFHCLQIGSISLIFVKAQHQFTVSIVQQIGWNLIIVNWPMSGLRDEFQIIHTYWPVLGCSLATWQRDFARRKVSATACMCTFLSSCTSIWYS